MGNLNHCFGFLFILFILSCSDSYSNTDETPESKDSEHVSDKSKETAGIEKNEKSLQKDIQNILKETPICDHRNSKIENCRIESLSFDKKDGHDFSLGRRVMILDTDSLPMVYSRYHERVLDFLTRDKDGSYQTSTQSLSVSRAYRRIFRDLLGGLYRHLSFEEISVDFNKDLRKETIAKLGSVDSHTFTQNNHGSVVLGTIAENSPSTEFVVVRLSDPKEWKDYCSLDRDSSLIPEFESYIRKGTDSLIRSIHENQINWINLSYGQSKDLERIGAYKLCKYHFREETLDRIFDILLENFYKPLGELDDVIFVQAGADFSPASKSQHPRYPVDCVNIKNRVRVGYKESFKDGDSSQIAREFIDSCEDVKILIPMDHMEKKIKVSVGWKPGVAFSSEFPPTTSFVAAIFTSYLIYVRNHLLTDMSFAEFLSFVYSLHLVDTLSEKDSKL